jgi:hypothetical protein
MDFWQSDLGEITGKAEDAFSKVIERIPNNTKALAKISSFINSAFGDTLYLNIVWELMDGECKGFKVFHKLKVFDTDPKKRHKALNMLKLLYQLFNITPTHSGPPADNDLALFKGKIAGIKIQETAPNHEDKQYNWISEVHPASGFKSETGSPLVVTHKSGDLESAFSRNPRGAANAIEDDLPF